MNKFPFIILAGSPKERDALMEYADVDYKALIEINGRPMIDYVLDTIVKSGVASYILITGIPENLISLPTNFDKDLISFKMLEGRMADKIVGGSKEILRIAEEKPEIFPNGMKKVLIGSGDIPSVTVEAIHDFINDCAQSNFEDGFYHSMVPREVMEQVFPDSGRSYMNLRDKSLCGGDIDMVDAPVLVDNYDILRKLTENRKFLLKGLFSFSPLLLFRFLLKRVKFEETQAIMTHFLTIPSRIVPTKHAVLGMDVDKPHQLDMMREFMETGQVISTAK